MDRVERGMSVETETESDEPFGLAPGFGLDSRRVIVEFLTVLALVIVLAAATSVALLPT